MLVFLPITLILSLNQLPLGMEIPPLFFRLAIIPPFIGLFFFFLKQSKYDNDSLYFLKLLILVQLSFSLLLLTFENNANFVFTLITVIFTFVYSLSLIASVLKDFENKWFHLFNMIFVTCLIIFVTGMSFGGYYFSQNEIFGFFSPSEFNLMLNIEKVDEKFLLFIIYKGLIPFHSSFEQIQLSLEHPETFMLLFENVLGFIFYAIIISFFISYLVPTKKYNGPNIK